MGDLSKNFNQKEFACKCGCGFDNINMRVVNLCQTIRDAMAEPLKINSGCRCERHNASVGSTSRNHVNGNAADLVCASGAKRLFIVIRSLFDAGRLPDLEYCELYPSFVHIDCDRRRNNRFKGGNAPAGFGFVNIPPAGKAVADMPTADKDNSELTWFYLKSRGFSDFAVAGFMGNWFAESALLPDNLQNSFNKSLNMSDAAYTAAVDDGSYNNFARDGAGYGLAQWTFWSRKQALLDFARAAGVSIGDLKMQLDFFWHEIQSYTAVMKALSNAVSVHAASNIVLFGYEKPADDGADAQERRAKFAQEFYDRFARKDNS